MPWDGQLAPGPWGFVNGHIYSAVVPVRRCLRPVTVHSIDSVPIRPGDILITIDDILDPGYHRRMCEELGQLPGNVRRYRYAAGYFACRLRLDHTNGTSMYVCNCCS